MPGELRPIMFHCDDGNHLVSRGDAERRNGEFVCPRHADGLADAKESNLSEFA